MLRGVCIDGSEWASLGHRSVEMGTVSFPVSLDKDFDLPFVSSLWDKALHVI